MAEVLFGQDIARERRFQISEYQATLEIAFKPSAYEL